MVFNAFTTILYLISHVIMSEGLWSNLELRFKVSQGMYLLDCSHYTHITLDTIIIVSKTWVPVDNHVVPIWLISNKSTQVEL